MFSSVMRFMSDCKSNPTGRKNGVAQPQEPGASHPQAVPCAEGSTPSNGRATERGQEKELDGPIRVDGEHKLRLLARAAYREDRRAYNSN